ncbi:helix-turn-helix transcriptional regulator [Paracoccus sp. (in: a-proteobacteria)]|uniref:helix-turn-helix domain-containing protein n=1 Tax=Paracoccus sp. TaxID=267 RepID=UPI002AFFF5BB|nr:helix-turn-helix transcriptional regulator [Paracoccus sp. (in: a-proteobacteria)]
MSVGERLAAFRKSLGKNQIQFAEELGVSQSAYKNYEREATDPPVSLAIKLCKEYGLSAEWLILGRSGMTAAMTDNIIESAVTVTRAFITENGFDISPEKEAKIVRYLVRKMSETGEVDLDEQYEIIRLAI